MVEKKMRPGRPAVYADNPLGRVARALGSYAAIGALCIPPVSRSSVRKWGLPVDRGGGGGLIPQCHWVAIRDGAKALGVKIRMVWFWDV